MTDDSGHDDDATVPAAISIRTSRRGCLRFHDRQIAITCPDDLVHDLTQLLPTLAFGERVGWRGGGRTLCLPFLRWLHRFQRPWGVPYPNKWSDRMFNYIVGFREVGLPIDPVVEHFRTLLGKDVTDRIFNAIQDELDEGSVQADASS